jgi:hypothetical protein
MSQKTLKSDDLVCRLGSILIVFLKLQNRLKLCPTLMKKQHDGEEIVLVETYCAVDT